MDLSHEVTRNEWCERERVKFAKEHSLELAHVKAEAFQHHDGTWDIDFSVLRSRSTVIAKLLGTSRWSHHSTLSGESLKDVLPLGAA